MAVSLVIMAAGLGSRYGGSKQVDGIGPNGEGYLRLTAFGEREDCIEAMRRIRMWI